MRPRRDITLAVDLGDRIGAGRWWRGLLTLVLLAGAAVWAGARIEPMPVPAPDLATPAEVAAADALTTAALAEGGAAAARSAPFSDHVIRLAEPPERPRIEVVRYVSATGALLSALKAGGVGPAEAEDVAMQSARAADMGALKSGTRLDLVLGRRETKAVPRPLESLAFRAAFDLKLRFDRQADGALAMTRIPVAIDRTPLRLDGRVGRSFHRSAREAGVPDRAVVEAARLLAYRLDFERDIAGKDRFSVVLAHQRAETGETIVGDLLYTRLDRAKGEDLELLRWTPAGGKTQFFLADGSSAKKGLMQTPIAGARMTSGFGLRMHPILGYSRFHRGVDFGAAHGTPILSAAVGRVAFAGRAGGYGNVVKVDHGRGLLTAYAHMSRIAVRVGQRVGQGDMLGAVGSTGMSTGPHLHYEVYQNGRPVDPRGAKFRSGLQLAGGELARFRSELERMRSVSASRAAPGEVAEAAAADPAKPARG